MRKYETSDTIWEVTDELWAEIQPIILELAPPKLSRRKRANSRQISNSIIFWLRSGCQWNKLPKELGDDSTVHRTFQRWVKKKLFTRIWTMLVERCEEMGGVDWAVFVALQFRLYHYTGHGGIEYLKDASGYTVSQT